jgi:hypothetical protein
VQKNLVEIGDACSCFLSHKDTQESSLANGFGERPWFKLMILWCISQVVVHNELNGRIESLQCNCDGS